MTHAPPAFERSNRLLQALPDAIHLQLKRHLHHTTLRGGMVCIEAGDAIERVYFPTSALISLVISTGHEELVEAGMVGNEGAVGLQDAIAARPAFTSGTVQVSGGCWVAPVGALRQIIKSSEGAQRIVNHYTEILWAEAQQLAACNAVHHALPRLARWLLMSSDRTNSDWLQLTQEFLSEMLGLRRTSVNAYAQTLQRRGIIQQNRGGILILDRAKLEGTACVCYSIIRTLYQRETADAAGHLISTN